MYKTCFAEKCFTFFALFHFRTIITHILLDKVRQTKHLFGLKCDKITVCL